MLPTAKFPTIIALTLALSGCAGLDPEPAVETEQKADAPAHNDTAPSVHAHSDSGVDLVARVPDDTFKLVNVTRNSVDLALLPLLLGAERNVLEAGQPIEVTLAPGEEFVFDAAFTVSDGFYTVDFALQASGIDTNGERVTDEAQVEWRVEVADGRATTADRDEWLAAIMHD